MGRNPLPSNQSLKLFLPRESQEEKLLRQGHSTHQTHWKKPGDTGNSCDTKKAGNSFCLKRVKTAILFRRISLWDFFFFLPKYSLGPHGGNSGLWKHVFEPLPSLPEEPGDWQ